MSTLKLLGLGIAWILAAIAIAIVTSIVATEALDLIGVVESGRPSYSWALNGIALVVFIGLLAVPFLLRDRFESDEN